MNKKYILPALALAGMMTSCYDLSTEPMGSSLTEEQRDQIFEKDPSKIAALSNGMYSNYNGFELCYGEMFDFGYPSIMLQLDCRTADFFSINIDLYGWFSSCAEYLDNTATSGYNIIRWKLPYNTIYTANQVLSIVNEEFDDDLSKFYRGQAYGNRAFAYWVLAQLYQFNYAMLPQMNFDDGPKTAETALCVPIITEDNYVEVQENGAPRATVKQVYDLILSDLNNGIELMTGNSSAVRADKRYIDLNVLYGLRARVYLCMQEYDKAAADAQTVINSGAFKPLSATEARLPGFITLSAPNWIWGINYDTEDVHGLYTLSGFLGSYTYGYAYAGMWKAINSNLYNRIDQNDARKWWWISPSRVSNAQFYTEADSNAAEYLDGVGAPTYAVTKFAPYNNVLGQSQNEADVPLMRIEEMYLILAEAQGMGSAGVAQGIQTLESFVNRYRWVNSKNPYSYSGAVTKEAFLDEVLLQRNIELWGEGMRYFDILRYNLTVDRTGSNWEDPNYYMEQYAYYISADDQNEYNVMIMQIPKTEIDNNPQISETDQNPTGQAN